LIPINAKYISKPFRSDPQGGYIFGEPDNFMFAQVRGWGVLGYSKEGAAIQDANLKFMLDALNEKVAGGADELAWLRFFRKHVYECLGAGSGDVLASLREQFTSTGGVLPKAERDD